MLVSLGLMVALAGCAPTPPPADPPSAPPSPSATAVVEEATTLGEVGCDGLLPPAETATVIGGSPNSDFGVTQLPLVLVGGIGCQFFFGEQGASDRAEVNFSIAPEAIADASVVTASLSSAECAADGTDLMSMNPGCSVTAVTAGWWYSVRFFSFASAAAQRDGFAAITALLEAALANHAPPAAAAAVAPFDCQSLATGSMPVSSFRREPDPRDGAPVVAAYQLAGADICDLTTPEGAHWWLEVYPGGAAAYESCAQPPTLAPSVSTPVTIPGIASAEALAPDGGLAGLCSTDGSSLIRSDVVLEVSEYDWNSAALAAAAAVLEPAFAAAL